MAQGTRFVAHDTHPDDGSLVVFDILEFSDLEKAKSNRLRLMRQFGIQLDQLLCGDIAQITVVRMEVGE